MKAAITEIILEPSLSAYIRGAGALGGKGSLNMTSHAVSFG